MARRRYRKNEGLIAIALRSNWKVAATLAAGSAFGGVVVIPALFGRSAMLAPVAAMLVPVAWFIAAIFAAIAALRFVKEMQDAPAASRIRRSTSGASDRFVPPASAMQDSAAAAPAADKLSPSAVAPASQPRPDSWSLDVLDRIEWKRFEDLCCAFYREKGIRAETTRSDRRSKNGCQLLGIASSGYTPKISNSSMRRCHIALRRK